MAIIKAAMVIDVDDVVTGDLVLLQSGDKIPADGVLIHGSLRATSVPSGS